MTEAASNVAPESTEQPAQPDLPSRPQSWPPAGDRFFVGPAEADFEMSREEAADYVQGRAWVWPAKAHYFLSDVHADADAFANCLVATGGVEKTGPEATDFELTAEGRDAVFVIGGDCFDKGPRNLPLLRTLKHLIDKGADVKLIAGNHDLRTVLGIAYTGSREPKYAHLFVRMGQKSMTLFGEICEEFELRGSKETDEQVRERLFPPPSWYDEFPKVAEGLIPPKKLKKELNRIREKESELSKRCQKLGLTLSQVHAAVEKAKELFLQPGGEFSWLFQHMNLAYRAGSFLFVHAGVDDTTARVLRREGVDSLNERYEKMYREDLFTLYHGPLGNTFRTKYRDIDYPLTEQGVKDVHGSGIYAIVHGHRNLPRGQRMMLRHGLMNFECDSSVDRNTRESEGLRGVGGAATVLHPAGELRAVSTDYPFIKVFDPAELSDSALIFRPGAMRRRVIPYSQQKHRGN